MGKRGTKERLQGQSKRGFSTMPRSMGKGVQFHGQGYGEEGHHRQGHKVNPKGVQCHGQVKGGMGFSTMDKSTGKCASALRTGP